MSEPMHCYRHPKRETRVSCATCGRPICTECMRQTEVGIKCPDDARLPRGARAGVMKPKQVLKSVLAGVGIAVVGLIFVTVVYRLPFSWLLSIAAGFGAGTLVNRAGGRNGGPIAMLISVVAVATPFLVVRVVPAILMGAPAGSLVFAIIPMVLAAVTAAVVNRQV
jgi:hypothetical protein